MTYIQQFLTTKNPHYPLLWHPGMFWLESRQALRTINMIFRYMSQCVNLAGLGATGSGI